MQQPDKNLISQLQDLDSLWNPADAPASEATFRELLPSAEQLKGKESSYLIDLLSFIGRAESVQGKLKEARTSLERAEGLLDGNPSGYSVTSKIRWLLERGRIHVLEKTPSQARGLFAEAWTLAINSGEDYYAVDVAQMMAVIEPQKVQQEWISRAIEIAENSPNQKAKRWLGGLHTTRGWKLYDLKQFENALETFQKAVRYYKATGTPREAFVAQWSIGKVLRALGRTEEALSVQATLFSELGIGGERDGRLYEELGECLQTLKRTSEAQTYFELAYRELSSDDWVKDNQPVQLKRMKDLGKVKS